MSGYQYYLDNKSHKKAMDANIRYNNNNMKIGVRWVPERREISVSKTPIDMISSFYNFKNKNENPNKFIVGRKYALKSFECEGFKMEDKIFELVANISNVDDVEMECFVMRQISGPSNMIFSLTKYDCELMGIEFQNGLQIFPKDLNWQLIEDEKENQLKEEINLNDLSTYTKNPKDGTIRSILLKVDGFHPYDRDYIVDDNGKIYNAIDFKNKLKVKCSDVIKSIDMCSSFEIDETINYSIIHTPKFMPKFGMNNCLNNTNLYIELCLTKDADCRIKQLMTI